MATPVKVMLQFDAQFLAAVDAYATTNNQSRAQVIRQGVANLIAYKGNPHQGGREAVDPEVRKAANKAKQAEHRANVRALINAFKKGERAEDILALARTMGINPEDI